MHSPNSTPERVPWPWLTWLFAVAGLMILNIFSQPYEDSISLVPPSGPFYLDPVWYLDDIIGPSLFMLAGIMLLRQSGIRPQHWAVAGLGFSCLLFSLGDTVDIHWVLPTAVASADLGVSFSSWMSKVMVVITFFFFIVHAYDRLERPAQKAAVFAFMLLYIDQIQMSISLDFAGYAFHVFEETLEVVTALFFCLGVARYRIRTSDSN